MKYLANLACVAAASAQSFEFGAPVRLVYNDTEQHFGALPTPTFHDWDNDGDLDLIVGRWGGGYGDYCGTIGYFRNDGTAQVPKYAFVKDLAAGLKSV